jgi:hypothetical protein
MTGHYEVLRVMEDVTIDATLYCLEERRWDMGWSHSSWLFGRLCYAIQSRTLYAHRAEAS